MDFRDNDVSSRGCEHRPRFRYSLRGLLTFVFCCGAALGILRAVTCVIPRELARRVQCVNSLKSIAVALHQYHDDYGCFPSPSVLDQDGKPMHSWRVALHSYVEDSMGPGFFWKYDFSQPWNSANNMRAARPRNPFSSPYRCPSAPQPDAAFTNYVMIVGADTACRRGEWTSLHRITDGSASTIIVAEIADSDILWTEPRDLCFDEMSFRINDPSKPGISSHHPNGAMVVFADGNVRFLDNSTDPKAVKAMLTSAGEEIAEN